MLTSSKLVASVAAIALIGACGGDNLAAPEAETGLEALAPTESSTDVADISAANPSTTIETETSSSVSDAPEVDQASTATSTAAPGPENIMIVMDGSGSMWGQIDGEAKMSIARTALRTLVDDLPADGETGLIAYGHRRKGDCTDIEILQPPAPDSKAEIVRAVDAISPRGKTPLSASVQLAANTLKYEEDRATVILITDGIETCDLDPCALGTSLEESGVDFTTHIVGFGLSEREGRQVACLAEETGGRYIEASNAGELADAMAQVAEAVDQEAEAVEIGTAEATLTAPETVEIGATFEVSWTGPDNEDERDYIDLVDIDYTKTSGGYSSWAYAHKGAPQDLRAPAEPGTYKVRYIWVNAAGREVIAEAPIEVIDAEVAIFAPERVGIGQVFEVTWRGPDNQNDYIDLVPLDQTETNTEITYAYTRNGEVLEMTAPGMPRDLQLRYVTNGSDGERVMKSIPITIEDIRAEVAFNPSAELGSTLEVDWTGPDANGDYIDIVERGFTATNTQLSYAYTRQGSPAELRLPVEPGAYDVRYIMSANDGERILASAPLELTDVEIDLSFASEVSVGDMLEVAWIGPNTNLDYIDIVERGFQKTNTQLSYAYTKNGNPAELRVPGNPGEYDVRYILKGSDGEKVMLTKPLTLSDAVVTMDHAGEITLGKVLEVEWTGPKGNLDYIDIVERGFRKTNTELSYAYTKSGDILELGLPAEPGEYDVRFVLKASDGERVLLSQPLTLTDVNTTLDGPETAEPDQVLEIEWEGPGTYRDFIDIVPRGKKLPKDSIQYAYTRNSNPVELKMPAEAGEYDIRYIHVASDKRVVKARRPIDIR